MLSVVLVGSVLIGVITALLNASGIDDVMTKTLGPATQMAADAVEWKMVAHTRPDPRKQARPAPFAESALDHKHAYRPHGRRNQHADEEAARQYVKHLLHCSENSSSISSKVSTFFIKAIV